ncbi:hypothetical protein EXS54_02970 [Patescibacteria group bacterium]|nr:hypothetical protein [Patescibacteria group bacterium]
MADKPQTKKTAAQAKKEAASTQAYLPIQEIKDGIVIMKDGSLRAVLMTSAVNFSLKSAGEQDAIIYAYQRFLNSLTFPIQILVQSRRLDLDFYLEKLEKRAEIQEVELVKLQILEYTEFIKRLISVTNIMDKRFFVVVPFFPSANQQVSKGISQLFATGPDQTKVKVSEGDFQKNKVQLMQRIEALASGLGGVGLRAATLNSEELVELFYSIYNPSTSTKQRLVNVDDLTAASIGRTSAQPNIPTEVAPEYTPVRDEKGPSAEGSPQAESGGGMPNTNAVPTETQTTPDQTGGQHG